MAGAKDILLRPIDAKTANALVRRVHYSGKVVNGSWVHIGVFYAGNLEGAIQYGNSTNRHAMLGLVRGTKWHHFVELNRLAFTDALPRNSESRAISISLRLLRRHAPQLKWVVSYADGTQCGDGTIYRASGFILTNINRNSSMVRMPDGEVLHNIVFEPGNYGAQTAKRKYGHNGSESSSAFFRRIGAVPIEGYQLRYIYFLDPSWRDRLTVPEIPYSKIWEVGAGMYRGEKVEKQRAGEAKG